ncbi:MAG TPA: radical SAM family heme chaperone HemW [Terriglobales bacterium]|nr:radical SAM family heme chaperone HemW [Terriglobales bacterium]
MAIGIYISVPFCRSKCSYCNFASGVFAREMVAGYVERIGGDIADARHTAAVMGGILDRTADSVYLGGGTPTTLTPAQLEQIFVALRREFEIDSAAEITVECAPGTLSPEMLEALVRAGVNRVSLGVQSFVVGEAAAVGRLHTRAAVLTDIARLRSAGITNINIDLIAGLPHQNAASWKISLNETIVAGVPHVSVYMLEVDEDSRLGRELIAGGTRFHAHFVPDEDAVADFYEQACARLNEAGIVQYEISNFTRPGMESKHNLKYWTRQPYIGFGMDAHSMLESPGGAVRISTPDSLDEYMAGAPLSRTALSAHAALEETFFLGLRLARGVDLKAVGALFGVDAAGIFSGTIGDLQLCGLLERQSDTIRLTSRGRLLSNEVFERFIGVAA